MKIRVKTNSGSSDIVAFLGFLQMKLCEQGIELIKACAPQWSEIHEPVDGSKQGVCFQARGPTLLIDIPLHETVFLQHFEIAGNGRLADIKGLSELCDGGFALDEIGQDGASGTFGERVKYRVQLSRVLGSCITRLFHNYMVIQCEGTGNPGMEALACWVWRLIRKPR